MFCEPLINLTKALKIYTGQVIEKNMRSIFLICALFSVHIISKSSFKAIKHMLSLIRNCLAGNNLTQALLILTKNLTSRESCKNDGIIKVIT